MAESKTKNVYWAVKYENGWFAYNTMIWRKRDAIQKYIDQFSHGKLAEKDWAWHKKNKGVSVVKVRVTEIEK